MSDENKDPMLDSTDLSKEGSVQYQERRIANLDDAKAAQVVKDFNDAIAAAGSDSKAILDTILSFGKTIAGLLTVLLLTLCLVGCGSKRPPAVLNAQSFKQAVLEEAISDIEVRNQAHYKGMEVRGQEKIDATTAANLERAKNSIEIIDGKPYVYRVVNGEKLTRPIDQYIMDCINKRDEEKAELATMLATEKSEDAKIAKKIAMVRALTALEEKYYAKIEQGTITPEDTQHFVNEAASIVSPYIKKN